MQSNKSNGQLTAQIDLGELKKSGFDLSNNVLGTGRIGRIIPTRALHVMPNDSLKCDPKCVVQFEPLAVPILANMDLRQEHFYVPYNIVWKNWDKFISASEKLDYKGVVPNVSMQDIYRAFFQILFGNAYYDTAYDPQNEAPAITIYREPTVNSTDLTTYYFTKVLFNRDKVIEALDTIGDSLEIKDLLKPQYEAINNMFHTLEGFVPTQDNKYIAFKEYMLEGSTDEEKNVFIKDLIYNQFKNPNAEDSDEELYTSSVYLDDLVDVLRVFAENHNGVLVLPTNEFIMVMLDMYDFIKSYLGISSNIDYLNMNRLVPTDLLYMYIYSIYEYFVVQVQNGTFQPTASGTNAARMILPKHTILSDLPMSVLNLRANYSIWYNNYRDILLEQAAQEPYDGDDVTYAELFVLLTPRQRCWEKDAFTTALDNPGTGNVGVPINVPQSQGAPNYHVMRQTIQDVADVKSEVDANSNNIYEVSIGEDKWQVPTAFLTGMNPQETGNYYSTGGFSLYALDAAQRAQKFLQKALFYGNRINDFYYMHFRTRYLDARLRLPELIRASSSLVAIDTIMNNTTTAESIAGDRAGFASANEFNGEYERFIEEHGVVMSYLTIMPQQTYAYGMSRDYSRLDQFDFAFPEFATLGMDAVYSSEVTNSPMKLDVFDQSAKQVSVFGYQGKYYDYKAKHSEEHGELLTSQDMYTFARKFNMYNAATRPKLNYEFVHCFPDLDMFVVDSTLADYFRYDIRHATAIERLLPAQSLYI